MLAGRPSAARPGVTDLVQTGPLPPQISPCAAGRIRHGASKGRGKGDARQSTPPGVLVPGNPGDRDLRWVRLFFVDGPRGFCQRYSKSYLTRRRRGGEGGGGGLLTGRAIPSAYRWAWCRWYSRVVEVPVRIEVAAGFVAPGASEPPRLQTQLATRRVRTRAWMKQRYWVAPAYTSERRCEPGLAWFNSPATAGPCWAPDRVGRLTGTAAVSVHATSIAGGTQRDPVVDLGVKRELCGRVFS